MKLALLLYEVGTIKEIPEINKYVSIDGGMSDHIRTAFMTQVSKHCLLIEMKKRDDSVTIAGKLCESVDIIIKDGKLPSSVKRGDYLALYYQLRCISFTLWHPITIKCKSLLCFLKDGKA